MKHLLIQSDGEHKGQDGWTPNWYLRECYAIQYALERNGEEAGIWGKGHENYTEVPNWYDYDVIWCLENSYMDWIPDLSLVPKLKIQWIIDLHCQSIGFYANVSRFCDIILHSTRSLIESYNLHFRGKHHIWFPNGVDSRFFNVNTSIPYKKKMDVRFVGSDLSERRSTIELLKREVCLDVMFATGVDMFKAISEARIHFNKNIGWDINYRTFETIGLGTCLVTNHSIELADLGFVNGKNYLGYRNDGEAVDVIKWALEDGTWEEIGRNGAEFALEHSYTRRIKDILPEIRKRV